MEEDALLTLVQFIFLGHVYTNRCASIWLSPDRCFLPGPLEQVRQWWDQGWGRNGSGEAVGTGGSSRDGVCQILSPHLIAFLLLFYPQICASYRACAGPRRSFAKWEAYRGVKKNDSLSPPKHPDPLLPNWI